MEQNEILEEIKKLKDGEVFIVPEGDYGKAEIWLKNETYFLFEIPMYGGNPSFHKAYNKHYLEDLVKVIDSWI